MAGDGLGDDIGVNISMRWRGMTAMTMTRSDSNIEIKNYKKVAMRKIVAKCVEVLRGKGGALLGCWLVVT